MTHIISVGLQNELHSNFVSVKFLAHSSNVGEALQKLQQTLRGILFLTPFVKIKYKHRAERQQRLRQAKHVTCQNTFPANFPPPLDTPLLSLIHPRHPFSPITEYKHFCFPKSFLTFHIKIKYFIFYIFLQSVCICTYFETCGLFCGFVSFWYG